MKRYTKIYYKNLLLSFRFRNLIAIWNAELKKSVWIVSVFSVWRWSWDLISHWLGVWIYYVLKNQNSLIKKFAQLVLKACSLVTPEEFILWNLWSYIGLLAKSCVHITHADHDFGNDNLKDHLRRNTGTYFLRQSRRVKQRHGNKPQPGYMRYYKKR